MEDHIILCLKHWTRTWQNSSILGQPHNHSLLDCPCLSKDRAYPLLSFVQLLWFRLRTLCGVVLRTTGHSLTVEAWRFLNSKNISNYFLLLDRWLCFSFSEEGQKGPVFGSEMPANSELLGWHVLVQAVLTLNCSLAGGTCLWRSSVILHLNRLHCASWFNLHIQANYTKMNSNCKEALKPTWLHASGSLLST